MTCSLSSRNVSTVLVAPSTSHVTRQTAKWINVVPLDGPQAFTSPPPQRRVWFKKPKLRSYYSKLRKDEAVLKQAQITVGGDVSDNELDVEHSETGSCLKPGFLQLSVDTAARLTLSVNFLLFFFKLGAAVQSGSLAVVSSLIDSTLDLLSGIAKL